MYSNFTLLAYIIRLGINGIIYSLIGQESVSQIRTITILWHRLLFRTLSWYSLDQAVKSPMIPTTDHATVLAYCQAARLVLNNFALQPMQQWFDWLLSSKTARLKDQRWFILLYIKCHFQTVVVMQLVFILSNL